MQSSKKVIQRRLEAINGQSPSSRPPNFYELLFLPQGATTSIIQKHFKMLAMFCHANKGGWEDLFKLVLQAKKIMEDEKARNIYDNYGIKKSRGIYELENGPLKLLLVSERNTPNF